MSAEPTWGRVQRGVVWHVLAPDHAATRIPEPAGQGAAVPPPPTWCGLTDPIVEETDLRPPRRARTCTRCCAAVQEYARLVEVAEVMAPLVTERARAASFRPVEDVDLLADLPGGE